MEIIDFPVKDIKIKYRFRQPSDQKENGRFESIKHYFVRFDKIKMVYFFINLKK